MRSLFSSGPMLLAMMWSWPGCGNKDLVKVKPAPIALGDPSALIGQAAPEIDGEDIDGQRFQLTDYRGKIVVVAFWGHWGVACRNLYAHERSLVERFQHLPVAFLGVNSDSDRAAAKTIVSRHGLNWRNWWIDDPAGPIPQRWGVQAWPALFVIDSRGVVRFKPRLPEEVDQAVQFLLSESQARF